MDDVRAGTDRSAPMPAAAARVRVVKYLVTAEIRVSVPIRREEIRVEKVPLEAPDEGPGEFLVPGEGDGPPGEIVLHAERPVVTVEVVPAERVRLLTEGYGARSGSPARWCASIVAGRQPTALG